MDNLIYESEQDLSMFQLCTSGRCLIAVGSSPRSESNMEEVSSFLCRMASTVRGVLRVLRSRSAATHFAECHTLK